MKYHIPKGTIVWRNERLPLWDRGAKIELSWERFCTTKSVTYTDDDILKRTTLWIQFYLPAAASPWKVIEVTLASIRLLQDNTWNIIYP